MGKRQSKRVGDSSRVTITKRAKATVAISVRSDGQLTLVIEDIDGDMQGVRHKMTGEAADVAGFIVGWMVGDAYV